MLFVPLFHSLMYRENVTNSTSLLKEYKTQIICLNEMNTTIWNLFTKRFVRWLSDLQMHGIKLEWFIPLKDSFKNIVTKHQSKMFH